MNPRNVHTPIPGFRAWIVLALPLLLAACATDWSRPGATPQQLEDDLASCRQLAEQAHPVVMRAIAAGENKQFETRCTNYGNQTNCTTRSSETGSAGEYDVNEKGRREAVAQCMTERGYRR